MIHAYDKESIILSGCLIINDKKEILLLYKKDHDHYETPGGKVHLDECSNPEQPSEEDLAKAARREAYEELGSEMELDKLKYFGNVKFIIPNGKQAIANKFITTIISGEPKLNEPEIFSKFKWISIDNLDKYPISPDLKLLLSDLKRNI